MKDMCHFKALLLFFDILRNMISYVNIALTYSMKYFVSISVENIEWRLGTINFIFLTKDIAITNHLLQYFFCDETDAEILNVE